MSDNGGLAISGRLGNEEANYPLSFGKGRAWKAVSGSL